MLIRFCPNCETERPLSEIFCDGLVDLQPCMWNLSELTPRPAGWTAEAPIAVPAVAATTCPAGHAVEAGDLICPTCGADVGGEEAITAPPPAASAASLNTTPPVEGPTEIGGWRVEKRLASRGSVGERFMVAAADGREAVLTLYAAGSEPDADVYHLLRQMDLDHVPELFELGHWNDRAYEVTENVDGGTLADIGLLPDDIPTLSRILSEVGGALNAFAESGLRHRDLNPGAILIRERTPLDLVITGFGSARLSEFDLDIVSPLEITRYTAPEAVAGGVAAASDWWSLGMVLLEQVTRGQCFAGVDDQTFLIHVLTNGAPIPPDLDPLVDTLLRGLLAVDRRERWGWPEVERWLAGDPPIAPGLPSTAAAAAARRSITLGGRSYNSPTGFALAAADGPHWDEALRLLQRGEIATWVDEAGLDSELKAQLRRIVGLEDVSEDVRLAISLKVLNPAMPLVVRGEIITPGWLLDHPEEGYRLIAGPVPDWLETRDSELWLARLHRRAAAVRERARQLDLPLDEEVLRVQLLSTSRARLSALWDEKRRILPDTDHAGLIAILERKIGHDEDLILLLSADIGLFRTAEAIIDEAEAAARRAGLDAFDRDAAARWLAMPRRDLHAVIEARLEGFARSGFERLDEWADQFRLERRLPVARALALAAVPPDRWQQPPKQRYVEELLDFYTKRLTGAVMRGPLTRMVIGKTTARLDLAELGSERQPASRLLDHLLMRNEIAIDLDPSVLLADPGVERRLRTLHSHTTLYRRDTGIDGLFMGFPFLVMQEARATTRPRIAPVLLWPVRLKPEVGARGRVSVDFDRGREEVRLNPAFEALLGPDAAQRWEDAARDLLARASLDAAQVMEGFEDLAAAAGTELRGLPSKDIKVKVGEDRLYCSAAFFHLAFVGQAVMEDLRQLKARPPADSALETALRIGEAPVRPEPVAVEEIDRYFTASSDPSQETAVLEARTGRGLLIEGPPGTGKSQTIVNMVADAIGCQKSLLIVCQKQAALEVVHKRLEAEGLGDRIMLVTDVNKDRATVIRTIREQLEALFGRSNAEAWRAQRRQIALRIEALEADLDGHHRALHRPDAQTGLSYRQLLGELIGVQAEGWAPSVPGLRPLLAALDPGGVALLEEEIAPLARLWLPARYEDSPFVALKAFGHDEATLEGYDTAVAEFTAIERDRVTVIEQTPRALNIEFAHAHHAWAEKNADYFRSLSEEWFERLAAWLTMLGDQDGVVNRMADLVEIEQGLGAINCAEPAPDAIEVVTRFDDETLADSVETFAAALRPPRWYQHLSIGRWLTRRRARKFAETQGLPDVSRLYAAMVREQAVRPWRRRLEAAERSLGLETDLRTHTREELRAHATRRTSEVIWGRHTHERLMESPEPAIAVAMAREGSRPALDGLLEAIDQSVARAAAVAKSSEALIALDPYVESAWSKDRSADFDEHRGSTAATQCLLNARSSLVAYQRFRGRVPRLSPLALQVFAKLRPFDHDLTNVDDAELERMVRTVLRRESRLAWKTRMEGGEDSLLFEATELEAKARALASADTDMRDLNRQYLAKGYDARAIRPPREWESITRLTGQRARRLREFLDAGPDLGLMALRPVWLMNPDVASRVLPLKKALFDTVIFDEASQMPIEYALPALYRAERLVVSGDEKQMPPTAFFASRAETDEAVFDGHDADEDEADEQAQEERADNWNRLDITSCPDLLQLAKTVLPSTTLQIHYRSTYRELIGFSNAAFYRNRLSVPARHPMDEIARIRPIEVVRVDGCYEQQTNRDEADRVGAILADLWARSDQRRPTIGVVTFNRKQADLIEEVLEARATADPRFRQALTEERDRIEGGEDMGFFVKNVENVQGDERDVIIFSSTFGRNRQGTFLRNFGVLGQRGGERRLNVAVTRAKTKIILATSMPIASISDFLGTRRAPNSARDYLQAYLEYAQLMSNGQFESAGHLLDRLSTENDSRGFGHWSQEDGFEAAVEAELNRLGYRPHRVSDDGAFGLDFAIPDPDTGLYGIGIECDAPRHGLLDRARAREMWRPRVLARSIGRLYRVSSHRWYHEPQIEKARLAEAVRTAMEARS